MDITQDIKNKVAAEAEILASKGPVGKEKEGPRCICGHLYSEHNWPTGDHNYSAARCTVSGCRCIHMKIVANK